MNGPGPEVAYAAAATGLSGGDLVGLRVQLVADAGAAAAVLLVAVTLSVYEPKGLTRRGWNTRRGSEHHRAPRTEAIAPRPTHLAACRKSGAAQAPSTSGSGLWPGVGYWT